MIRWILLIVIVVLVAVIVWMVHRKTSRACQSDQTTSSVKEYFTKHPGSVVIPADDYKALLGEAEDEDRLLLALAEHAKSLATHVVISHYQVGACVLGDSGTAYLGANCEFEAALSTTIHGEQCSTHNAAMHGEKGLKKIGINASPCGHCRQFLVELGNPKEFRVVFCNNDKKVSAWPLQYLIPDNFGPVNLGLAGRLLASEPNDLEPLQDTSDKALELAYEMAQKSYVPYSLRPSGVALQFKDGSIVGGMTLENAAYNPSVSAARGALSYVAIQGKELSEVVRMVMAEAQPTLNAVSRKAEAQALLLSVNPKAQFQYEVTPVKTKKIPDGGAAQLRGRVLPLPL